VVVGRAGWPGAPAVVRFVEDTPRRGPLSALYTGLGVIERQRTLAVGCDMPFISPELLRRLVAGDGAASATVVRTGAQVQPLLAVYHRGVRPVIGRLLASGERSLMALLGAIDVRYVDLGAGERSALSINTPEDLQRAEELLRTGGEG
jgi:molybdopterin-guanine dinucleotide biosynthesis protein A